MGRIEYFLSLPPIPLKLSKQSPTIPWRHSSIVGGHYFNSYQYIFEYLTWTALPSITIKMVFFCCDGCGETFKKAKVDQHAAKCRECYAVSWWGNIFCAWYSKVTFISLPLYSYHMHIISYAHMSLLYQCRVSLYIFDITLILMKYL